MENEMEAGGLRDLSNLGFKGFGVSRVYIGCGGFGSRDLAFRIHGCRLVLAWTRCQKQPYRSAGRQPVCNYRGGRSGQR